MTAAYADPGLVLALIMIPALAQGWVIPNGGCPGCSVSASEVTRTVMLPLPFMVWRAKWKLSVTATPPGPMATTGLAAAFWVPLAAAARATTASAVSTAAAIMAITQPRTVRNLVHSARSRCAKSSCPGA